MKNSLAYPGIGGRLRAMREQLGESQTVFAARFGLNRGNIDSYERARADLPTKLIGQLIELGLSAEWLINDRGARYCSPVAEEVAANIISISGQEVRAEYWKLQYQLLKLALMLLKQRTAETLGPDEARRLFEDLDLDEAQGRGQDKPLKWFPVPV